MYAAPERQSRRYLTLAIVVGVHVMLVAALLSTHPLRNHAGVTARAVELIALPPVSRSRLAPQNFRPHRLGLPSVLSIAPPVVGSMSMTPASSGSDGNGAGVDWRAEARRALQASEIRSSARSMSPAPSSSSADDEWWSGARHRAGDQYKTNSGDWIVWINANCYQLARATASTALGSVPSQTICPSRD